MFIGFDLKAETKFFHGYEDIGNKCLDSDQRKAEQKLDRFMAGNGVIDGSEMQESWFPQTHADIFISHSHQDQSLAISIAGWLYQEFGLQSFIDSCIWGYADNLLSIIDERYCQNKDSDTYNYKKRNRSTSNVHMMLSTALTMMIDKTECVLFLNTPRSINQSGVIDSTYSPWLYHELAVTKLIRKKPPQAHRTVALKKTMTADTTESLTIRYQVPREHLYDISIKDLAFWKHTSLQNRETFPLDQLYRIKRISAMGV